MIVYLSALPLLMRTSADSPGYHKQPSSVDTLAVSTCTAEDVLVYLNKCVYSAVLLFLALVIIRLHHNGDK